MFIFFNTSIMIKKIHTELQGGKTKMAFKPIKPNYSGDGVAIWNGVDKNGKHFLKVQVLKGKTINCFRVEEIKKE